MTMTADEQLEISDRHPEILLRASIVAGREHLYSVVIHPERGSAVTQHDLFRFVLHYYAHALYVLMRHSHSVRDLPAVIDRIVAEPLDWNADLFTLAHIRGALLAAVAKPVSEAHVVFRRTGYRDFDIAGDIPFTGTTLACSVLAVLQSVAERVSPDVVHAIRAALANMNVSYVVTHRYSDPLSCQEVPALAYYAAAFV